MKKSIYCVSVLFLISCAAEKQSRQEETASAESTVDGSFTGSCPFLFESGDTAAVFSWVRTVSDSGAVLVYAVSNNGDFTKTITVPGSNNVKPHGENMPKVVIAPDGRIVAAWGAANPSPENPYSGLVFYSSSADGGKNWTSPATLSQDKKSIDQRYFDLEVLPDGQVGAVWLDSRKNTDKDGSSLYFAKFSKNSIFENEKVIDQTVCQCCRTDLFVDDKGSLHVAYRKIIDDSVRDMVHIISTDNGANFSKPERISPDNWVINGCPHTGPAIAQTSSGLSFVWYTMGSGKGVFYASSKDDGKTFAPKNAVGNNPTAKHPQIQVLKNGNQAIVWDERTENGSVIGLEIRSSNGEKLKTGYLTSQAGSATFPVIKSVGNDLIVAYAGGKTAGEEQVYFQKVNVDEFTGQ